MPQHTASSGNLLTKQMSAGNREVLSGAQTVTSGFFNPHKHHQSSTNSIRSLNQNLGFQNLSNFQWLRNTVNPSDLLAQPAGPAGTNQARP